MKRSVVLIALVLCAGVLGGCSSFSGTTRQQVNQWASEGGLSSIDGQIDADLSYLRHAANSHDLVGLKTDCEGFPGDVEALYEMLPSPSTALTNELNNAVLAWNTAASACVAATSLQSGDYQRYLANFAKGNGQYALAKKRLASFGVQ